MKPILHDLEYDISDHTTIELLGADLTPAYYALLKDGNPSDIEEYLDEDSLSLMEMLAETVSTMPQYENEEGLNYHWRAYGVNLINDLRESLGREEEPTSEDIDDVCLLVNDWIAAYEASDLQQKNMDSLIEKAGDQAADLISNYKLEKAEMQPALTAVLAKLVIIDGFEKSLADAISKNEDGDVIRSMQIAQNISNHFKAK